VTTRLMRKRITIALLAGAVPLTAGAQTVLQLPASPRALGVGDAFVAGRGSDMIFYNPALLALQPGLSASLQRFGAASSLGAISSSFSTGPIAGGVGAQLLDYGASVPGGSRAGNLGARGSITASSTAAAVGAALLVKGVRVGAAAKYVEERVGSARDGGAAFDAGLARDFFGRATIGVAVRNLGEALTFDGERVPLPMTATLGAAAFSPPLFTFFDLNATAAVSYRRDGTWIPAGGLELTYVPLDGWAITGRAGARRIADDFGAKPLTLGAGLSFDRISLDYAYHALDGPESAHRIGLRLR
jgi:hypothetical protein